MRELRIRSNGLCVSERKERGRAHWGRWKWPFEAQGKRAGKTRIAGGRDAGRSFLAITDAVGFDNP